MAFKDPPEHDMFTKRSSQLAMRVSPAWLSWWQEEITRISQSTGLTRNKVYMLVIRELEQSLRQVERQAQALAANEERPGRAAARR